VSETWPDPEVDPEVYDTMNKVLCCIID